ncbi:uncharacterized protein KZ484_011016 [Pholidichthys leucotaenia]
MMNQWWIARAEVLQEAADKNDVKAFYDGLKAVYGLTLQGSTPIERPTAAEEETRREAEQNIQQDKEKMESQKKLLDFMKLQTTTDFPEHHVCANKFSPDQQLWNQEENSGLEQEEPELPQVREELEEPEPPQVKEELEEPEPPQMKEEPELPQVKEEQDELEAPPVKEEQVELCISTEGEQLVVKLEANTFVVTVVSEEIQQSEAEPNSEQLLSHNYSGTEIQDEEGNWHVDSGLTKEEESKPKKRRLRTQSHREEFQSMMDCQQRLIDVTRKPVIKLHRIDTSQLHDCKEEEVLTVQQLSNQERNASLDQEEQDAAQVKKEEELCTSQEEEHFGLKQETDTFMVTTTDEHNGNSKTEPNSEQPLCHNSPDTESQDQGVGKNVNPGSSKHEEPKKKLHRNRSERNIADNSSMSENQCDTDAGEKSVKCSVNDKDSKNESRKKKLHTVKSYVCNMCGKRFRLKSHLSVHERIHTDSVPAIAPFTSNGMREQQHIVKWKQLSLMVLNWVWIWQSNRPHELPLF